MRVVQAARSAFLRCSRADDDPRYARYPRLPVTGCPGHVRDPAV